MAETTNTYPHQDILKDNSVNVTELPQKTQDLIAKFSALTDDDAKEAMDLKIYGQIEDYLEDKAKKEKEEKLKAKVNAHKEKKKAGNLDVSGAATAKTKEQEEAERAAAQAKANTDKKGGLMNFVFGRK